MKQEKAYEGKSNMNQFELIHDSSVVVIEKAFQVQVHHALVALERIEYYLCFNFGLSW